MVKRLALGLVVGMIVGVLLAAAAVAGLHMDTWTHPLFAYVFAAATGAATGLVAGKPVWAKGAMIEAWLKAFFGALLAAGGMFALQKWGMRFAARAIAQLHVDKVALGAQPATALPMVGAVLGALFGLDNTPEREGAKTRVAASARKPASPTPNRREGTRPRPSRRSARAERCPPRVPSSTRRRSPSSSWRCAPRSSARRRSSSRS